MYTQSFKIKFLRYFQFSQFHSFLFKLIDKMESSFFFKFMNKYQLKQNLGKFGEQLATKYLAEKGFIIVKNNYRCFSGEIDIIAEKKDLLLIVEVKSRSKIDTDETLLSITKSKQRKISRATADFVEKNQQYSEYYIRFDVITVVKSRHSDEYKLNHYDDAFCYLF